MLAVELKPRKSSKHDVYVEFQRLNRCHPGFLNACHTQITGTSQDLVLRY